MSKQDCKVFIGGLSWETTGEKLRAYFENWGAVREAFVSYNRNNGRPRGFGFVVFESPEIADKVVASKHTIDRREVEAKKAVPKDENAAPALGAAGQGGADAATGGGAAGAAPAGAQKTRKIFVGGLAPGVDDATLRQYFEQFGEVEDAIVMVDHDNKRPRGFGFVSFALESSVDSVFGLGTMQCILEKQIEIKPAVPRDQMPSAPSRHWTAGLLSGPFHPHQPVSPFNQPPHMDPHQQHQLQLQRGMPNLGPYGTPARPYGYASHMAPPGGFPQPYNHLRMPAQGNGSGGGPPRHNGGGGYMPQQQQYSHGGPPHHGGGGPRPNGMMMPVPPRPQPQQQQAQYSGSPLGSSPSNSGTGMSPGGGSVLQQAAADGQAYPSGKAAALAAQQAAAAAAANGYGDLYSSLSNGDGGAGMFTTPAQAAALYSIATAAAGYPQHLNGMQNGAAGAGVGGGNGKQQHGLSSLKVMAANFSPYGDSNGQPGSGGGGGYDSDSAFAGADSADVFVDQVGTRMAGLTVGGGGGNEYNGFTSAGQMGSGWSH